MPRRAKGPRLWFNKARGLYFILDTGGVQRGTGCDVGHRAGAEIKLAEYAREKHQGGLTQSLRDPSVIPVADVINLYLKDIAPHKSRSGEIVDRLMRIANYFTGNLDSVNGAACRAYAKSRSTLQAARRELEDFRSAINHHRAEGLHDRIVSVTLPDRSPPRERWLTRKEAATLILAAWRYRQNSVDEDGFRGLNVIRTARGRVYYYAWRKGPPILAKYGTPEFEREYREALRNKPENWPRRHVARFMLVARYMGSRAAVICGASIEEKRPKGKAWVDLRTGIFYGRPAGERETNKRKQKVEVPPKLLAHMRRWRRKGQRYVVEWQGKPVGGVDKAHRAVCVDCEMPDVTPHVWRHSVATWLLEKGKSSRDVADYLAMSEETLKRVYGHVQPGKFEDLHGAL